MEEERLMKIEEVANYLRVSQATVFRIMRSGELLSKKISAKKFTRIKRSDLMDYVERYTVRRDRTL
jgi:excisionase family DNA binding protein